MMFALAAFGSLHWALHINLLKVFGSVTKNTNFNCQKDCRILIFKEYPKSIIFLQLQVLRQAAVADQVLLRSMRHPLLVVLLTGILHLQVVPVCLRVTRTQHLPSARIQIITQKLIREQ